MCRKTIFFLNQGNSSHFDEKMVCYIFILNNFNQWNSALFWWGMVLIHWIFIQTIGQRAMKFHYVKNDLLLWMQIFGAFLVWNVSEKFCKLNSADWRMLSLVKGNYSTNSVGTYNGFCPRRRRSTRKSRIGDWILYNKTLKTSRRKKWNSNFKLQILVAKHLLKAFILKRSTKNMRENQVSEIVIDVFRKRNLLFYWKYKIRLLKRKTRLGKCDSRFVERISRNQKPQSTSS